MTYHKRPPRVITTTVFFAGLGIISGTAGAAPAPPSSGQILQQNVPQQQPPPAPPKSAIHLPGPVKQKGHSQQKIHVRHIRITGNQLLTNKTLRPAVAGLTGKTVTLGRLRAAAHHITRIYHRHDYPLAYAYLPTQTIKHGNVRIAVVEPHYDHVTLSGKAYFNKAQAHHILGLHSGQPIRGSSLQRGLLALNRTPGLRVNGTLVPGAKTGTSSLKVELHNTRRVRATVGLDNYGNKFTGQLRTNANIAVNNPFGLGSKVAVNGLITDHNWLRSVGGTVVSPELWRGVTVGVYGSTAHYQLGKRFSVLNEHGMASQIGADIQYPILLAPGHILSVRGDFIHDTFTTDIRRAGVRKKSHINLGRLSLDGATRDGLGGSDSGLVGVKYGRLGFDSRDARVADANGPQAGGKFWIGQFQLAHDQPLPHRLHLRVALRGQIASKNLDASQKLYLGGPYGVMSYPVGDAGGDSGILGRFRLDRAFRAPHHLGVVTPALLAQAGYVRVNHRDYNRAPNKLHRYGVGAGLRYSWHNVVSGRVAYIRQVGSREDTTQPGDHGELWGRLQITF